MSHADSQLASEFGVAAGHEGGRLFVPYLDETDLFLPCPECLDDSVDAVSRHSKDDFDPPID
jgi:hypothetical protein